MTRTLYDKLVDSHKVCDLPDGDMLIYVDFHIMNEYTSPQAFSGLENKGLKVWRSEAHLAVVDHVNATRSVEAPDAQSKLLIDNLEENCTKHQIAFYGLGDPRQGIEHDDADLGRKLAMPILALWAKRGVIETCFEALSLWRQRAEKVEGEALDATHYMAEEMPEEVAARMFDFFARNPLHKKETSQ